MVNCGLYVRTARRRTIWKPVMKKKNPMRRFGAEGDLDGPLLLLASPAGAYMTGSLTTVDGGHTLEV